jgi:predicted DNA-binding transcriptional regulator AlpA
VHHLVGASEIAAMLGVSRQRAHVIARKPGFPEPVARLTMGLVWQRKDVERWCARHWPGSEEP